MSHLQTEIGFPVRFFFSPATLHKFLHTSPSPLLGLADERKRVLVRASYVLTSSKLAGSPHAYGIWGGKIESLI
ncbi:hypothetical protein [Chitinophaga barathri]|uniref:hypothetical protein n=1 Tax=Chitinophaga barathri TaxID=1647451 RepID=UPI000F4E89F7|nr:hypothetical protein [Chitinophaga barathri]